MAERILEQEHKAAERIRSLFDQALDVALDIPGVSAR